MEHTEINGEMGKGVSVLNVGGGVSDFCHLTTNVEELIVADHLLHKVYLFMHSGDAELAMSSLSFISSSV